MSHLQRILSVSLLLASALASASACANERSLENVNFMGPLITPNPAGLPQGRWFLEPYLVRVDSNAHYDADGERQRSAQDSGAWAVVMPVMYGFSDRLMGQVNLSASRAESAPGTVVASAPAIPPPACSTCCRRPAPMASGLRFRWRCRSASAPAATTASPATRWMRRAMACSAPPSRSVCSRWCGCRTGDRCAGVGN